MGFAESHATQENDIGRLLDKLQPEQLLNLKAVDFFRPGPIELIQGFNSPESVPGECGVGGTIFSQRRFAVGQFFQIVFVRPTVFGGLFGPTDDAAHA